jgi:hypothetical protein
MKTKKEVICSAFWGTRKRAKPVVEFFNGDPRNFSFSKVSAETRETFFEIVDVCRAHPIFTLRFQHFFRQIRDGHVAPADSFQVI